MIDIPRLKHAPKPRLRLIPLLLFVLIASGSTWADSLNTVSYNFQLGGGGGGASAILDGNQSIEIFCVDFAHYIVVPKSGYTAYLNALTSADFLVNSSQTRFGNVTSWFKTGNGYIDGITSALSRYQMAAYLVSSYTFPTVTSADNGIQAAIWSILDPASYNTAAPQYGSPTTALQQAAQWFQNTTETDRENFLASYRIVSDTTMVNGAGGFQEQITRVPEPASYLALAFGLAGLIWAKRRGAAQPSKVAVR